MILKQVLGLMLIVLGKDALQMLNPDSPFEPMGKNPYIFNFYKNWKAENSSIEKSDFSQKRKIGLEKKNFIWKEVVMY